MQFRMPARAQKGIFDRVNDAVFEMLNAADAFDRDVILQQAENGRSVRLR